MISLKRFSLRSAGLFAGLCLVVGPLSQAWAQQSDQTSARSVVQITCKLSNGQASATGFVWSKPTYVVTALHAVAGCKRIDVWSEATKKEDEAKLIAAHLESDLALLELGRDLGLKPLRHSTSAPPMNDEFYLWGYPRAVPSMLSLPLRFSRGLQSETTLGAAFFKSPDDLDRQLGGQSYPQMGTKILRVGSTMQPGHSGAPIFDRQGQVVAIADGGLYSGTAGINWSIPAHVYLPGLLKSGDSVPKTPSKQLALFSTFAPKEEKSVAFQADEKSQNRLVLVRVVPLLELGNFIGEEWLESYRESVENIASFLPDRSGLNRLSFDVYEDFDTGATIALPTGSEPTLNRESGLIETSNDKGNLRFITGVIRKGTFAEAADAAKRDFMGEIEKLASWKESLVDVGYSYYEEDWEYANLGSFYDGTDKDSGKPVDVNIGITVEGEQLLGSAVLTIGNMEDGSEFDSDDIILMMMMQLSRDLAAFAKH